MCLFKQVSDAMSSIATDGIEDIEDSELRSSERSSEGQKIVTV